MPHVCILSSVHRALDNRVFYREARSLKDADYKVTLVAVYERDEVRDGVRIVSLPLVPRWQRPLLWRRLVREALAAEADVYHFHDPELLLVAPWLRLRTGKPTIYDVHEANADFIRVKDYLPAWVRYPLAGIFGRIEPLLARFNSALIFADDQIATSFLGVRRPKATLYNFPARSFVEKAAAATRDASPRPPVVLYLGGLERNRGSRLMVEAFYQVWRLMPEARLLHVGHMEPPDLEDEVRADVAQRGMKAAVTLTGRRPFEEIGHHLARAAVGWVPWQAVAKNQKNVPTKLFEYMAYGLPVVSSDLPSTRPFVHEGRNGHLVAAGDPAAHAEALLELLHRPEAAAALGRKGQELVRTEYNWNEMEKRLLALYQELLS